jgi:hypothetical protein
MRLLPSPTACDYGCRDGHRANCTWVATAGPDTANPGDAVLAVVRARDLTNHPNDVQVNLFTSFSDTEFIGQGFQLMVLCL